MSKMRAGRVAGKPLVSSSFDCNQKQGSVAGCKCSATLPLIHTVFNFEKDLLKPLFSPLSVLQEEPSLSLVDMNYGILCEHHNGYLRIENTEVGAKVSAFFKTPVL